MLAVGGSVGVPDGERDGVCVGDTDGPGVDGALPVGVVDGEFEGDRVGDGETVADGETDGQPMTRIRLPSETPLLSKPPTI